MPLSTTYPGLKADILSITEEQSDDLLSNLDLIIKLGENMVAADLDLEIFQLEQAMGTLTIGQRTIARPALIKKIENIWLVKAGARAEIFKRTKGYCEAYGPDPSVQEFPSYYAEQDEQNLYFVNTPDQAYPIYGYGLVAPGSLSGTNPTTWMSLNLGDLLTQACLICSEEYLQNAAQVEIWKGHYTGDQLPKAKLLLRGMGRATYEMAKMVGQAVNPT